MCGPSSGWEGVPRLWRPPIQWALMYLQLASARAEHWRQWRHPPSRTFDSPRFHCNSAMKSSRWTTWMRRWKNLREAMYTKGLASGFPRRVSARLRFDTDIFFFSKRLLGSPSSAQLAPPFSSSPLSRRSRGSTFPNVPFRLSKTSQTHWEGWWN